MVSYVIDGTLYGLLTAIFESFERRQDRVTIISRERFAAEMFGESLNIYTDCQKAERVWTGLGLKIGDDGQKRYYSAFLAEDPEVLQQLFDYARYIFSSPAGYHQNYGNKDVLAIAQAAKKVHREKHRMEAFIRFRKSGNGLFFAVVHPDFNVLPLLIRHFRNRYADQVWVIYDERRKYGIHYDLQDVHEIMIDYKATSSEMQLHEDIALDPQEQLYALLWKDYFKSTNIVERKNMKLHLQHVPKRYWRYLTEKTIDP